SLPPLRLLLLPLLLRLPLQRLPLPPPPLPPTTSRWKRSRCCEPRRLRTRWRGRRRRRRRPLCHPGPPSWCPRHRHPCPLNNNSPPRRERSTWRSPPRRPRPRRESCSKPPPRL
ncbi:unnamed protein product, partial [Ectocarpus sp. 8 AP-2014]